jgi:hypothetical protein
VADISPELIAEIESVEPDFVIVADATAVYWFEMAHAACATLGLESLHEEHCLEPGLDLSDEERIEQFATSAENILNALRVWLREHDVPRLSYWFESVVAGCFLHASIKGTEGGSFQDEQ